MNNLIQSANKVVVVVVVIIRGIKRGLLIQHDGFLVLFCAKHTERNLVGLDLAVLLKPELVSYCFELKPF